MTVRHADGSAGDADYGQIGGAYSSYRQPDPRIAGRIEDALGNARTVLNVGAGAGSYEPTGRDVTAVEPSGSMRAQRPPHLPEAIDATAESLPFADYSFDAAMTTFSIHQWSDLAAGLRELRRVTTGPIVIMTCDPELLDRFWLAEYAPEVIGTEARRYPSIAAIREVLGDVEVLDVPVPLDCSDGFNEAYYGRPEMLLDPAARASCSAWSFVDEATVSSYSARLRADLADGAWDRAHGELRTQPTFDGSLVLVVSPGRTP
ncbi:class I SAM-dependent methyltransferase [Flexivirga sp. B27]